MYSIQMYQEDFYNPADPNDHDDVQLDDMFEKAKRMDKGYNTIYRKVPRKHDGILKNKKIEIYTSSGTGSRIRDAETGEYFSNIVGSKDEDLFFKVALSTGECTSANGSNILFFVSPQHYANKFHCEVDPELALAWEQKRNERMTELRIQQKVISGSVEVR